MCVVWCLLRAKLFYHCKAQESHSLPYYMSDAVVAEMQNGWDLNQLKKGNEETLKGTVSDDETIVLKCTLSFLVG